MSIVVSDDFTLNSLGAQPLLRSGGVRQCSVSAQQASVNRHTIVVHVSAWH
jgi:hypothetical protein